jgi:hypothetical protein
MKVVFWTETTCNAVDIYVPDGGNTASVFKVEEWSETVINILLMYSYSYYVPSPV